VEIKCVQNEIKSPVSDVLLLHCLFIHQNKRKKTILTIDVDGQARSSLAAAAWTPIVYLVSERNLDDTSSKNSSFS